MEENQDIREAPGPAIYEDLNEAPDDSPQENGPETDESQFDEFLAPYPRPELFFD